MKKKGFTLIELLGVIVVLGLLLLIVVPTIQKYLNSGKNTYYSSIEGEMKAAGMDYLESYRSLLPKENGNVVVVSLSELVANKYIDDVKDENGNSCTGQVAVKRINSKKYEYYSCLQCGENGKFYVTGDKIKTANGEEVSICTVDDTKNVYSNSGDYRVEAPCGSLGTCDAKTCTDPKTCTNPNPAICTGGNCPISLNTSTRTLTVYQGKGSIKVPYGKVYYKNNPDPIKDDLMGSPSLVDISKLGKITVTYSYRGQIAKIYVNVIDNNAPDAPSIALRENSIFGNTYDSVEIPWFSGNIFATFRSTDFAGTGILGSGIKEYRVYPSSQGSVTAPTNTSGFSKLSSPWETMTLDGEYTRYVIAVDNNGNESAISQYTYRLDKVRPNPPTIEATSTPTKYGWYSGSTEFNIVAHGDVLNSGINKCSGVRNTAYKVSGDTVISETSGTKARISNNGISTIQAYVYDVAGNKSNQIVTKEVKVDKDPPTAPVISIVGSPAGQHSWYRENVTLKITQGTDELSGVARVVYTKEGRETAGETEIANVADSGTTSGNITITSEGSTIVRAYTIDKAGNKSAAATFTVNIDKTAPNTPGSSRIVINSNKAYGDWYKGAVSVTVTANEDVTPAGANAVSGKYLVKYYVVNGGTTIIGETMAGSTSATFNIPSSLSNGTIVTGSAVTIYAFTVDKSGHVSSATTKAIAIDNTAPTCTGPSGGSTTLTSGDRTISRGCSDVGSGCTSSSGWSQNYNTTVCSTATAPAFTIYDNVGNYTTCGATTVSVYVDKADPSKTSITGVTCNGTYEDPVTASFSATDTYCGLSHYLYSINGGSPSTQGGSVKLSDNGTYYIKAQAVDRTGRKGTVSDQCVVTISKPDFIIVPNTTANPNPKKSSHPSHEHSGDKDGGVVPTGCWVCSEGWCDGEGKPANHSRCMGGDDCESYTCGSDTCCRNCSVHKVKCPVCGHEFGGDDHTSTIKHCKHANVKAGCGKTIVKAKITIEAATNVNPHRVRFSIVDGVFNGKVVCTASGGTATNVTDTEIKLNTTGVKYSCSVPYKSGTSSSATGFSGAHTMTFEYSN